MIEVVAGLFLVLKLAQWKYEEWIWKQRRRRQSACCCCRSCPEEQIEEEMEENDEWQLV